MIKLMLTFVNSGLCKTMIIIMLNIMPKNPKVGANTPLTTRSNNSVEGDGLSLSFSIFFSAAYKVSKQNITTKSLNSLNKNHLLFNLQGGVENLIVNL